MALAPSPLVKLNWLVRVRGMNKFTTETAALGIIQILRIQAKGNPGLSFEWDEGVYSLLEKRVYSPW